MAHCPQEVCLHGQQSGCCTAGPELPRAMCLVVSAFLSLTHGLCAGIALFWNLHVSNCFSLSAAWAVSHSFFFAFYLRHPSRVFQIHFLWRSRKLTIPKNEWPCIERTCASQESSPGWIAQRVHFSGETQPRALNAIPTGTLLKYRFAKPTSLCKHQLHHNNYTVKFICTHSIFANELLAAELCFFFWTAHTHILSGPWKKVHQKEV